MIIARAAYLELCGECGRHGHIICADGTKSEEFATRRGGQQELAALMLAGRVAQDESREVRRQIEEAQLSTDSRIENILGLIKEMKGDLHELLEAIHAMPSEPSAPAEGHTGISTSPKRTLH